MATTTGRKWLRLGIFGFLALILAAGGFILWKQHVLKAQETRALQAVNDFLSKGEGSEALAIIQARNRTTKRQTDQQKAQWQSLEIQALTQVGSLPRLLALYDQAPDLFDKEEV